MYRPPSGPTDLSDEDEAATARALADAVRARAPTAQSLLQVGCGTGALLRRLTGEFEHVEGVEWNPALRDVACRLLPTAAIHGGDPRTFDLRLVFDVVLCTGDVVASLDVPDESGRLFGRMGAHLADDGVVVIEPWQPARQVVPAEYAEALDQAGLHCEYVPTTTATMDTSSGSGFVIGSRQTRPEARSALRKMHWEQERTTMGTEHLSDIAR